MNTVLLERIEAKVKAGQNLTDQEICLHRLFRAQGHYCKNPLEMAMLDALIYLVENTPPREPCDSCQLKRGGDCYVACEAWLTWHKGLRRPEDLEQRKGG